MMELHDFWGVDVGRIPYPPRDRALLRELQQAVLAAWAAEQDKVNHEESRRQQQLVVSLN